VIDVPALFDRTRSYWYWQGFNWIAIAWTALGFGIYTLVPQSLIKDLTTTLIVVAGYTTTMKLVARRSAVVAAAARPGSDAPVDIENLDRRLVDEYRS
jgi:cytosine/uracil/thiamine/allantoin permease